MVLVVASLFLQVLKVIATISSPNHPEIRSKQSLLVEYYQLSKTATIKNVSSRRDFRNAMDNLKQHSDIEYLKLENITMTFSYMLILEELEHFENLVTLEIYGSDLKRLPYAISKLKKLENLLISKTFIRMVPLEALDNLVILYLSENYGLENIVIGKCNLPSLKELVVTHCKMIHLDQEIFRLENLETLIVHDTDLKYVPSSLKDLKNLKHVDLSKNRIPKCNDPMVSCNFLSTDDLMAHFNDIYLNVDNQKNNVKCLTQVDRKRRNSLKW